VKSFGTSLSTLTNSLAGSGGALDSRTDGINDSIKRLTDQGDALSVHLKQIEARYRAQYTALDVLMASMQTTSNFLTQQLANLPKTSNSNN
jgi:flagellar hook-associated protein 2